jgi:predicted ferric reductase
MAKVIKVHKIIGYVLICIFLVHPFLIVLPRYFEAGVEPADSLITILSTYSNQGVLNGILAWLLLFTLLITALLREKIPLTYKTWTTVHKWLSITFIIFACLHAIDLGRHTDGVLSAYVVILSFCGILLLLKDYILQIILKSGISRPGNGK